MPENQNELAQTEAEVLALGRRLGLLLQAADMPDEQKQAWASLVPEMNAQQMSDLADALARRIPDAEEQSFSELATSLDGARARYVGRVDAATAEAQQALSDVERELKPPAA